MTLVQLEYIVAVDTYKSFVKAAESCFVTQPTLSMQIQKLEELLNVKIFDRSKQPISATAIGAQLIKQARVVLQESEKMRELIANTQNTLYGELRLGIIPTIAPYLLPELIAAMRQQFPELQLSIWEYTTDDIVEHLHTGTIDCGLLATPLSHPNLKEIPLYYEPFVAYVSERSTLYNHEKIKASDLDQEVLWLLTEGHCMRSQVLHICGAKQGHNASSLQYQTGSVETLIRMVDVNGGATLLPLLALDSLSPVQLQKAKHFPQPEPVREISLVTSQNFVKERMLAALQECIKCILPDSLHGNKKKSIVRI